jgi:carbamate kinase
MADRSPGQRVVVALGGNALSPPGGTGDVREVRAALDHTASTLVDLVEQGAELILTHGNGPQVGRILLQQEYASAYVPPMPMDVCGAQSQGQIGYLLCSALDSAMQRRGLDTRAVCLVTQVLVDGHDPAFRRPTKPVGPFYERPDAQRIAHETGYVFGIMPDGRWRRLVPSPVPQRIAEEQALRALVDAGYVVVAAGGGGVPVVDVDGELHGVEAVIDKDRSGALLASLLGADQFVILTEVSRVQTGFGTPDASELERMSIAQARTLLAVGEFPEGSMGPKVAAGVEFVSAGGRRAVIGALDSAHDVVFGAAGTVIEAE